MINNKKLLSFMTLIFFGFSMCGWFEVVSLEQILLNNPSITYTKCFDKMFYENKNSFDIEPSMPKTVVFDELFILSIP